MQLQGKTEHMDSLPLGLFRCRGAAESTQMNAHIHADILALLPTPADN